MSTIKVNEYLAENKRIKELLSYKVMDTDPEKEFGFYKISSHYL